MKYLKLLALSLALVLYACNDATLKEENSPIDPVKEKAVISIQGEQFLINGKPTYEGRTWEGNKIEGLLFNSRMVQGIFDDLNPETAVRWKYPDTDTWSADRNTDEFVAAMEAWHAHGLLSFTINMQGGSPMGYGNKNWYNSAYEEDGDPSSRLYESIGENTR